MQFDELEPREEILVAALLYLMTQYGRTGCPRLAVCVSRHLQCLAVHPGASAVVRDTCAALDGAWTTCSSQPTHDAVH